MSSIQIKENQQLLPLELQKKTNRISTTLYSIYTFLPLGVWNQVTQATNFYFIIISIISLFPQVSSVDVYSAILPTLWVICFSLCFDYYDDLKRYVEDTKTNNLKVSVIRNGRIQVVKSSHVKIGDFLVVEEGQRAMADIVLMTFVSTQDYAYIDTSNLDGEKTLKPKVSVMNREVEIQAFLEDPPAGQISDIIVNYKDNVEELSFFEGNMKIVYAEKQDKVEEFRLDSQNFIPRSAMIRNTNKIIGLVVYIGKDTKIMKNMQARVFKQSALDKTMNKYIFLVLSFLLVFLLILSFFALGTQLDFDYEKEVLGVEVNPGLNWIYVILAYLLLMNIILPLSLVVSL